MTTRVDVAVVGAGLIGTAAAWRLSESGRQVALVDPQPMQGASRAAAGMLAAVAEVVPGEERLSELTRAAAPLWPGFARELERATGHDPGFWGCGTITAALTRDDLALADHLHDAQVALGLPVDRLLGRALRSREPLLATGIAGGSWAPDDHQVDPRACGRALTAAATAAGVRHVRRTAAAVTVEGGRATGVVVDGGSRVTADSVLLAAGWASRDVPGLPDEARPPTRPVKGQILRLRGAAGLLRTVVRGIVRGRRVYIVPRRDGRVVVGSTSEERGADTTVTAGGVRTLLDDAVALLPSLDECELVETHAGLRPGTPDGLPVIGATSVDGLLIATGHHRNGVLLAPLTADAVVTLIDTGAPPPMLAGLDLVRFATTGAASWS